MYTYQIYTLCNGFYGFRIYNDENLVQFYDNDYDYPGQLMTEEVAIIRAENKINLLNNEPIIEENNNIVLDNTTLILPINNNCIMGPVEFLGRFTQDELNKLLVLEEQTKQLYQKSVLENNLDINLQNLYSFFVMWNKATEVNLKYPATINGLTLILSLINIPMERIQEILTC